MARIRDRGADLSCEGALWYMLTPDQYLDLPLALAHGHPTCHTACTLLLFPRPQIRLNCDYAITGHKPNRHHDILWLDVALSGIHTELSHLANSCRLKSMTIDEAV